MKNLIAILALIFLAEISTAQTLTRDTTKLFYGLSPEKFLALTPEEGKILVEKHKIKPVEFLNACLDAENVIHEKQIIKDSLEILRIYDRIDRKLRAKPNHE